jgi:integrase
MKRWKTKYTGVYERKSDVKMFKGKPDICFDIVYRNQGRLIWEKVGWLSEGYSATLADQVRSDRIRAIRHSVELPGKKAKAPTFEDIATKYKTWAKDNKSSWQSDVSRIDTYLIPALGKDLLNEISSFRLEKFKSELVKKELAPATVAHCLKLFRQIFNKALVWGMFKGENPIKGVKMPTIQNQRERFLSYDEAKTLLEELKARSQSLHDMAVISLQCGLRAGEIFSLKGQHIDLENGIITITDPKNRTARKAYMTNTVKDILENRMTEKEGYIFPDKRHGSKIMGVSKAFSLVVDDLGFNKGVEDPRQKVTFHTLRHSFASWLALGGESLMTIRELLGHKSFAMTQRYAHLVPDEKRKATLKLEQAFNNKPVEIKTVGHGE